MIASGQHKKNKQRLAAAFLGVFIISCAGSGLGMIAGSVVQAQTSTDVKLQTMSAHGGHAQHDCCGLAQASAEQKNGGTTAAHAHHKAAMTADVPTLFAHVLVFAIFLLWYMRRLAPHLALTYGLYLRRTQARLDFLIQYITLLFSNGILHPKTW